MCNTHTCTHTRGTYLFNSIPTHFTQENNCQMYITYLKMSQKHIQWEILNQTDMARLTKNNKQTYCILSVLL